MWTVLQGVSLKSLSSVVQGAQIEWGGAGARPAPGRFAQKSPNSEHPWPAPDITS